MSDLIERQAAIDEIKALYEWHDTVTEDRTIDHLKRLPSAQPEIVRCKDCKYLQKWRSEESAKKFGQIYECVRNVFDYPKPENFCSYAERRPDE